MRFIDVIDRLSDFYDVTDRTHRATDCLMSLMEDTESQICLISLMEGPEVRISLIEDRGKNLSEIADGRYRCTDLSYVTDGRHRGTVSLMSLKENTEVRICMMS